MTPMSVIEKRILCKVFVQFIEINIRITSPNTTTVLFIVVNGLSFFITTNSTEQFSNECLSPQARTRIVVCLIFEPEWIVVHKDFFIWHVGRGFQFEIRSTLIQREFFFVRISASRRSFSGLCKPLHTTAKIPLELRVFYILDHQGNIFDTYKFSITDLLIWICTTIQYVNTRRETTRHVDMGSPSRPPYLVSLCRSHVLRYQVADNKKKVLDVPWRNLTMYYILYGRVFFSELARTFCVV